MRFSNNYFWCCLVVLQLGCTGSRWARDDPDYAAKYSHHTDNVGKTIKQAVDARHLRKKGGIYSTLSGQDDPVAVGGEIGLFYYPKPYVEERIALAALGYEDDYPASGGVLLGGRLQSPSRIAPFVGSGIYVGQTPEISLAEDGIDNNSNGIIDDDDEVKQEFIGALVPEVGCHYWLSSMWRVTGSASYYITTTSSDDQFLMFNVSLARLANPGQATSQRAIVQQAKEKGWQVGDGTGYEEIGNSETSVPAEPLFAVPQPLPPVITTAAEETIDSEANNVVPAYAELVAP